MERGFVLIKQIWHIRNLYKLLISLSFTFSIFLVIYTFFNILVLDDDVIFSLFSLNFYNSKIILSVVPVTLIIVQILHKFIISNQLKKHEIYLKNDAEENLLKISYIRQKFYVYSCFSVTIILFFLQIDILNQFKQIQGFGFFPVIISIIIYIIIILHTFLNIRTIKNERKL